ncbi:LCP family protein [Alicyclobacillus cycloheptanicus]|uniref:LCP family protein required for cell wall assembly n=1 Tax=Alicyclobacillus cycloheptanicus TaxID=1457 RepID=A0ABT9XFS6_9BACL|nr:LCP family protein [Alicyclobacillus cycloheptanicus]MDQ0188975.1 LCP family protein required for cell wall assembly [Alicyclobacillus cycloheptanicus]WDM01680.1 LCP family protein [Alicyclobacillus cycloheptanicus]
MTHQRPRANQRRPRKVGRWIGLAIVLIIVILGFVLGPKTLLDLVLHPKRGAEEVTSQVGGGIIGNKPVNILLIANNARDASNPLSLGTGGGQADILIVAHVDPATHVVSLISIPRDTLIAMPDYDVPIPKIKTTFTVGLNESPQMGPKLAMQYVSKMIGMPIDDYIVTDFQGFANAIDAVGGITVDVKERIYDPGHSGANLNPGVQTLNGQQALAYIRVRQNDAGNDYRTNDFQRQQAEMQVLDILKQKLLASSTNPSKVSHLIQVWKKDVVTNMTNQQLLGVAMATSGSTMKTVYLGSVKDSMDLASAPAPGINKENYLTGAYYDVLDANEITKVLKPLGSTGADLGLAPIPAPSQIPVTVYGSQVVADELQKAGYPVTYAGSSASGAQIQIYYPPGDMPWGWAIARTLGTANEWVAPAQSQMNGAVVYAP